MNVRTALNHLLSSPLFARFEAALKQESIFDVLEVGTREVSHAAFLRWLLDPQEGHGAGDRPLRLFLMRAAAKAAGRADTLTPVDVDVLDLSTARAECEYPVIGTVGGGETRGRLDILVALGRQDDMSNPLLIVEHKVYAEQSGSQTELYAEWASRNKLTHDELEGERRPLLVYVCPSLDAQSSRPAEPFVVFEYEDLSAWLDGVLEDAGVSERGRFLIGEFKACLTGRDLFHNQAADTCMEELLEDSKCAEAVKVLKDNPAELRGFDRHVVRHHKAFDKLEIRHKRVASRGYAATVVRFRELCDPVFEGADWVVGGRSGSVSAWYRGLSRETRMAFGNDRMDVVGKPYLGFYFSRPEGGEGILYLYGGVTEGDIEGRKPTQEFVKAFAANLRERVPENVRSEKCSGNYIAKVKLNFPGIENTADDTDERVGNHEGELQRAVEAVKKLKGIIEEWGASEMPAMLKKLSGK